jgi:hypothetical protein
MFRFTIRDVLWLTVVVAVLAWYWSERHRMANAAAEAERQATDALKRAEQAKMQALITSGGGSPTPAASRSAAD